MIKYESFFILSLQQEYTQTKLHDLSSATLGKSLDVHIAYKLSMITDLIYLIREKIDNYYFNIHKVSIKVFKEIGYDSL